MTELKPEQVDYAHTALKWMRNTKATPDIIVSEAASRISDAIQYVIVTCGMHDGAQVLDAIVSSIEVKFDVLSAMHEALLAEVDLQRDIARL